MFKFPDFSTFSKWLTTQKRFLPVDTLDKMHQVVNTFCRIYTSMISQFFHSCEIISHGFSKTYKNITIIKYLIWNKYTFKKTKTTSLIQDFVLQKTQFITHENKKNSSTIQGFHPIDCLFQLSLIRSLEFSS